MLHLAALAYLLADLEYLGVWSLATVLLGTLLTACNYWLWLSPMDRVRDVSQIWLHNILSYFILSSLTLVSATSDPAGCGRRPSTDPGG